MIVIVVASCVIIRHKQLIIYLIQVLEFNILEGFGLYFVIAFFEILENEIKQLSAF